MINALILALPVILIRYGLLALVSREALERAAFVPPVLGKERVAFFVYPVTTLILLGYLALLRATRGTGAHWIGLIVYVVATA